MSTAHLDAIQAALAAAGLAGTTTWPARQMQLPATPDRVVVIYPTGGPEPEAGKDRPTFQILVRGARNDVDGPFNQAELIRLGIVDAVSGMSLFRPTQSTAFALGPDGNARFSYVVNFRGYEA